MVRLLKEPLAQVDKWASQQDDRPSRPEAIRRLIEQSLGVPRPHRAAAAHAAESTRGPKTAPTTKAHRRG
jgi:hypothetical protein